jgi:hypothetical protein
MINIPKLRQISFSLKCLYNERRWNQRRRYKDQQDTNLSWHGSTRILHLELHSFPQMVHANF